MTNPIQVEENLGTVTEQLDTLSKDLATAHDLLNDAEAAWEEVYDTVAESLKEQMVEEGRKGDPAEHVIVTATRREHRTAYQNYRRAKRAVEKLERISQNRRAQLSGYQSQLKTLNAEANAPQTDRHEWEPAAQRRRAAAA